MKNITYIFLVGALTLQSCSHTVVYCETEYNNDDSAYPAKALRFAYPANERRVSPSIATIGDRVYQKVVADKNYKTALASAVKFETTASNDAVHHGAFEKAVSESESAYKRIKSTDSHNAVLEKMTSQLNTLSPYSTDGFKDYWKKIFQLSHRGIIQHYMSTDADYKGLSSTNKALVYGYILKKDISGCRKLAEEKAHYESAALSSVKGKLQSEIATRKAEIQKIEQRRRAEEERLRKKRQAEERARQERIEREQAQRRWNDDSWMDGKWALTGVVPGWATTVYIDTESRTVKQYTRRLGDLSYPRPDYSGRYSIQNGTYNGINCKIIDYDVTRLIVFPGEGRIMDVSGYYFSR